MIFIKSKPTLASLSLIVLSILLLQLTKTVESANYNSGPAPTLYGRVFLSPLTYLAPDSADNAFATLETGDFVGAQSELEVQQKLHPDSLAIITGLLQASIAQSSPDLIEDVISRMNSQPVAKLTSSQKFELATALYYEWSREYFVGRPANYIRKAQQLLSGLWTESHDPIVGLTLADTLSYSGSSTDAAVAKYTIQGLLDQLVSDVGGSRVASLYDKAESDHWTDDPPATAGVAQSNLLSLLAVVESLGNLFNEGHGVGKLVDGVMTPVPIQPSPTQLDGQRYFNTWHLELLTVLGLQPLHPTGT